MFGRIKKGFNGWLGKLLPPCRDISALVSRSLDKDLSLRERLLLKTHLYICVACRQYLSQLEFMSEAVRKSDARREAGDHAPRLSAEAAERLKNALKSSKYVLFFVLLNCY